MDTSDQIQQLETQLSNAVSYKERSAIRTRLRELRKEMSIGRSVTNSLPILTKTEIDSTLRPKSAVLNNDDGNNTPGLENGYNRRSLGENAVLDQVKSSKSTQFSKDVNSKDNNYVDRFNGNSYSAKSNSYQQAPAGKDRVTASKTPPARRRVPNDTVDTRGRSRTIDNVLNNDIGPEAITIQTLTKQQIQFCLTEYLNRELKPNRKIVPTGESLYLVCADPRILCRLVNVSKKNTIDMRCLTEISDTASDIHIKIAVEENMTLAVESARSIGCHITEEDVLKIIHHDRETIHKVLLKILQARVIDFGGMEEMPSSYFSQPSFLFEQLNLTIPPDSGETIPTTDTTQFLSSKITSSNGRKISEPNKPSDRSNMTSSQENLSRNSAVKIRRVSSDLPPDVKGRPENKPLTKNRQTHDVRGLAASFEKIRTEPVSKQLSVDAPVKMEFVKTETKTTPTNQRRQYNHKDVVFTKSSDYILSSKSAPLLEQVYKGDQSPLLTSVDNRSEVIRSPSRSPKKYLSHQSVDTAYKSPRRAKKSESQDDILDSVFVPKTVSTPPTQSPVTEYSKPITSNFDTLPTEPAPPQEPVPISTRETTPPPKLTVDLTKTIELPDTPLTSADSTPVVSTDATKDSDEYLLSLQDTDPSLTYEQRKRIRQLKRMRKQKQTKN